MKRSEFLDILDKKVLVLDGGYGTQFMKLGFGGIPGEVLNLKNPEAVEKVHRSYVEAGSNIILTNTFSANSLKLRALGHEKDMIAINRTAVAVARRAGGRDTLVFGDMSSCGEFPVPAGSMDFDACVDIFRTQASILAGEGVDGFIIETMSDIKELKAALLGVREASPDLPLIVHMTFDETFRSVTGTPPEAYAALFDDLDCDVIGINCSVGPAISLDIIRKIAAHTSKPLSVEPNAGAPVFDGVKLTYNETPEDFAMYTEDFINAGCRIIGGCCGTSPDHIKLISHFAASGRNLKTARTPVQLITSRTAIATMDPFINIGERINPAGRERFQKQIVDMNFSQVLDEAASQKLQGATVLDTNLGIEKLLTPEHFVKVINELDRASSLPLSLDIQTPSMMELAARHYSGRPLLNSARVTDKNLPRRIEILKKYGGMLVLLAMGKEIPETARGRFDVIMEGIRILEDAGISRHRVLADALVMSFGAGKDPAVTLETFRLLSEEGIKTTCGLSNLSFGMPDRSYLNGTFLTQALDRGLTSAIMNPGDEFVMGCLYGTLSLAGKKLTRADVRVSENPLVNLLLEGNAEKLLKEIKELCNINDPVIVSQEILGKAMEEIGILYGNGKIYLPHLLLAAQTSQLSFDHLNSLLAGEVESKGRVLLATVEGDVHDIGKKIVGTVLKTGGFEVIDLGKDISAAKIVEKAMELKPDIIGLSAMMTTTVGRVSEVASALKAAQINAKLICGGASMTADLATKFGADGFAKNASSVTDLCHKILT